MNIALEPGKYVVAVSGGVDSVVLLDILRQLPDLKLIVAHFDHGIREDSAADRRHVETLARHYGVPFVFHEGKLGPAASEAVARQARYDFLHHVRQASGARAVVTAHHQDDVLETAILNILRGTGRRGLSSLRSTDIIKRPLLDLTKRQLQAYARAHKLTWREDSTNRDDRYRRNYIRKRIIPRFTIAQRQQLLALCQRQAAVNDELEGHLVNFLHSQPHRQQLQRSAFIGLPHAVAREVLAQWLRSHDIRQFDRRTLERLVVAAKTAQPGAQLDIVNGHRLVVEGPRLALRFADR